MRDDTEGDAPLDHDSARSKRRALQRKEPRAVVPPRRPRPCREPRMLPSSERDVPAPRASALWPVFADRIVAVDDAESRAIVDDEPLTAARCQTALVRPHEAPVERRGGALAHHEHARPLRAVDAEADRAQRRARVHLHPDRRRRGLAVADDRVGQRRHRADAARRDADAAMLDEDRRHRGERGALVDHGAEAVSARAPRRVAHDARGDSERGPRLRVEREARRPFDDDVRRAHHPAIERDEAETAEARLALANVTHDARGDLQRRPGLVGVQPGDLASGDHRALDADVRAEVRPDAGRRAAHGHPAEGEPHALAQDVDHHRAGAREVGAVEGHAGRADPDDGHAPRSMRSRSR